MKTKFRFICEDNGAGKRDGPLKSLPARDQITNRHAPEVGPSLRRAAPLGPGERGRPGRRRVRPRVRPIEKPHRPSAAKCSTTPRGRGPRDPSPAAPAARRGTGVARLWNAKPIPSGPPVYGGGVKTSSIRCPKIPGSALAFRQWSPYLPSVQARVQSSTANPAIRPNSEMFPLTSVNPFDIQIAAIFRSFGPIVSPRISKPCRISP